VVVTRSKVPMQH